MGGAGAVLGAARVLAEERPERVETHFIIASCENMVSAEAMRPGDILTASNQKTIEVLNTDAEGRLTLAGACIVALGPDYAGMWFSDDGLKQGLLDAAKH